MDQAKPLVNSPSEQGIGSSSRMRISSPASTHPLISTSTFTFIASWKGQLLVCTICFALGAIYFVVREPISAWLRNRREVLSRVRGEELMSMEVADSERREKEKDKEKERDSGKGGEDIVGNKERTRGRDKKRDKEAKRRRGQTGGGADGLLKVPGIASNELNGSSSPEVSPAASSRGFVTSGQSSRSPSSKASPLSATSPNNRTASHLEAYGGVSNSDHRTVTEKTIRGRPTSAFISSTPDVVVRPTTPISPWLIPLPVSPLAGPSRSTASNAGSDVAPLDEVTSDCGNGRPRAISGASATSVTSGDRLSSGFSIIPEAGYLPLSSLDPPTLSAKKRRKRGKSSVPPPLDALPPRDHSAPPAPSASMQVKSAVAEIPSAAPRTPSSSRHARKASLTRPIGADLEDLLTEREKMIDSLRADIGLAKAEEAKAIKEASRSKAAEERLIKDMRSMSDTARRHDQSNRKREHEFTSRLSQLSSQYTSALNRINALEALIHDSGSQIPASIPSVPGSSVSMQQLTPQSPYGFAFPSPSSGGQGQAMASPSLSLPSQGHTIGMVPYPSPGMYHSPMLHPNYQQRTFSPSAYRRASSAAGDDTNGLSMNSAGLSYDPTMTQMGAYQQSLSPNAGMTFGPGGITPADLRRVSIEASVLKKKANQKSSVRPGNDSRSASGSRSGSTSNSSSASNAGEDLDTTITQSANQENAGLGVGDLAVPSAGQIGSGSGSPPSRILTPSSVELYQQSMMLPELLPPRIGGNSSYSGSSTDLTNSIASITGNGNMKVVSDGDRGNVYFQINGVPNDEDLQHTHPALNGDTSNGGQNLVNEASPEDANEMEDDHRGRQSTQSTGEDYVPMFASIAHTPDQLAEIQRYRDAAIRSKSATSKRTKDVSVEGGETGGLRADGVRIEDSNVHTATEVQ